MLGNGGDKTNWSDAHSSEKLVYTEWKYSLNNVVISCGVFAFILVLGLVLFVFEIELGVHPEVELILKTDQKRLELIRRVLPKDELNYFLLS